MKANRSGLWNKNFTIITLGTMISAIGGTAMGIGLSLVVFDQTQSTWLSAVFAVISMLPGVTLPILLAPVIDRVNRKRVIVGLDALSGALYLLFLVVIRRIGFRYEAYLLFSLVTGCVGTVYSLTYDCLYPDLIPQGMAQQGYAVSGVIYPLAMTVVTPLAALIYARFGIELLFLSEGALLLLASAFESQIDYAPPERPRRRGAPGEYGREMMEGVRYLKREKGVRNIYLYMMATNAAGRGNSLMTLAHFGRSSHLTTAMYGLLTSAEMLGRVIGSALHYLIQIPEEKRYAFTVKVYALYEVFDGILLFAAYPAMLVLRFVCGFLGVQTAAVRAAATQSYIPENMRARVNGLFEVLMSLGAMAVQLCAGALGERFSPRAVALGFAAGSLLCMILLIVRRKELVTPVYNRNV
ncbi:MAG: MFS transporter [Clostridia bacterium]|nr:MFS transporter [Clostridia bacterium]